MNRGKDTFGPRRAPHAERSERLDLIAFLAVCAAVGMNALLAFINAHFYPITENIVMLVQILVTGLAGLLIVARPPRLAMAFITALIMLFFLMLAASVFRGWNIKVVYDLFIIPIYMILGMTVSRFPIRAFNNLFWTIFGIAVFEATNRLLYTAIFNPLAYFRASRPWAAKQGSALEEAGLYGGSDRAGGSFFSLFADHRVGSVFLEPLSLGYFALIASIIYITVYRDDPRRRWLAIIPCLVLALLSDSRVPSALIILFAAASSFLRRLPVVIIAAIPALVLSISSLVYAASAGSFLFNDTLSRLAISFAPLVSVPFGNLIFGGVPVEWVGDSGLVYLIYGSGLLGALIAIYVYSGFLAGQWNKHREVLALTAIYFQVTLLFGGAALSIKTAALLGLFLGVASRNVNFEPLKSRNGDVLRSLSAMLNGRGRATGRVRL